LGFPFAEIRGDVVYEYRSPVAIIAASQLDGRDLTAGTILATDKTISDNSQTNLDWVILVIHPYVTPCMLQCS
jgi:hypothetical protein